MPPRATRATRTTRAALLLAALAGLAKTAHLDFDTQCQSSTLTSHFTSFSEEAITLALGAPVSEPSFLAGSPDGQTSFAVVTSAGLELFDWRGELLAANDTVRGPKVSGTWASVGFFLATLSTGVYRVSPPAAAGEEMRVDLILEEPGVRALRPFDDTNVVLAMQPGRSGYACSVLLGDAAHHNLTCFNPQYNETVNDLLSLGDGSVLATLPDAGQLHRIWPDAFDLLVDGFPLTEPWNLAAVEPDPARWGGFGVLVNNRLPYDGEHSALVGVDVAAANCSVVLSTDLVSTASGMFVNASNGAVLLSSLSTDSIVAGAPCDAAYEPDDDDDDDDDGHNAGDDDVLLELGLGLGGSGALLVAMCLGVLAVRHRRRMARRRYGDLSSPLLSDVVMTPEKWLIDARELKLGRCVGSGAAGKVYHGRYGGARVAIKRLAMSKRATDWVPAVTAEAKVLSSLLHPFVLRCYGFAVVPRRFEVLVVTERCALSLQDWIDDEARPLPERDQRRVATQMAKAFVYVHGAMVLHRDLKPANVLIHSDGNVRVADFGLARIMHSAAAAVLRESGGSSARGSRASRAAAVADSVVAGTPGYIAPEVYAAEELVGPAADVFAFGVLLNAMATREDPFFADMGKGPREYAAVVAGRVIDGERPAQLERGPHNELIRECWAQLPAERPDFAAIVARLLSLEDQNTGRSSLSLGVSSNESCSHEVLPFPRSRSASRDVPRARDVV